MPEEQAKLDLLPHSEAKVELYGTYLSIYLNILSRVPSVKQIYLFDLLCGEGEYKNGRKGSPLIALQTIQEHFANNNSCPDMEIWFNDNEESNIEPNITKSERVKRLSQNYFIPENVELNFYEQDYNLILPRALATLDQARRVKGLFFIDPYGYKVIRPLHIKRIMAIGNSEVILFLPISFMYRFVNKALQKPFAGSEPLAAFMAELYDGAPVPTFRSAHDLVVKLKERFHVYLAEEGAFVDTFTIERDPSNLYCLLFFTCNIKGLEKMLEAKWLLDTERGQGYSTNQGIMLLPEAELQGYPQKLRDYLNTGQLKSNKQVHLFGLKNGFLPKHTAEYLRDWQQKGELEVIPQDGKKAKKGAFYLGNERRLVKYRILTPLPFPDS